MPVREYFFNYFRMANFFLRATGILSFGGSPSTWKSSLTEFLAVSSFLNGLYVRIQQINDVLFRSHVADNLLEAVITSVTFLVGQFRLIFGAAYHPENIRLFSLYEKLWDNTVFAACKVLSTWAKWRKLFSTTYVCAAQCSLSIYLLNSTVKQLSSLANSTAQYYLLQSPEELTSSPQYEVKYTIHLIIGYFGISSIVAVNMTGTLFVLKM